MLEVNNIDVYYEDFQALWNVFLALGEREIVALIGVNGAGKSTIPETISSLLTPATGSVTFNGTRID